MGIQDRDYWRERYHSGVRETRDYSQQLRDLEAKGHRIDMSIDPEPLPASPYRVAILLISVVVGLLAFFAYKVVSLMF